MTDRSMSLPLEIILLSRRTLRLISVGASSLCGTAESGWWSWSGALCLLLVLGRRGADVATPTSCSNEEAGSPSQKHEETTER
mmetsp:Transcript_12334/g.49682  ORF Transcript_12334/g.49682 Transcript_12334/m.49682 type:complete len:83 (-) Transcript_12334:1087-1335(-)